MALYECVSVGGTIGAKQPLTYGTNLSLGVNQFYIQNGKSFTMTKKGFVTFRIISDAGMSVGSKPYAAIYVNGTKVGRAICTGLQTSIPSNKTVCNLSCLADAGDTVLLKSDADLESSLSGQVYFSVDTSANDDSYFQPI